MLGLETDFQGADISNSGSKMDWFGTVRGRLGYAVDRVLLYGTGGFAYGDVSTPLGSEIQHGWVAGGGVEYKFNPSWSTKVEYQYINLNAQDDSVGRLGDGEWGRSRVNTFRAGVNYFVGNVYEPLK